MNTKHNQCQRRAALLAIVLLLLLLTTGVGHAQIAGRRTVAVPEIFVRPQFSYSKDLGRATTEAMTKWITKKLYFDVTPRTDVEKAIKDLHFIFPLTQSELLSVGKKLGTDRIGRGEITEIEVTQNPRRARVKLSLTLIDTTTGELAGGFESTGFSPLTSKNIKDETLIQWAMERAVHTIPVWYPSITSGIATVVSVQNAVAVTLNRGSRDGFRPGDELNVYRKNRRIGRLRLLSVDAMESRAITVSSREPFRPEDWATQDIKDVLEKQEK